MNELVISQCKEKLSKGRVEEAIDLLLENTTGNGELYEAVLLVSGSFQRLKPKLISRIIEDDEGEIQLIKITKNILDILSSYS